MFSIIAWILGIIELPNKSPTPLKGVKNALSVYFKWPEKSIKALVSSQYPCPARQIAAYGLKGNISTVLASLLLARSFLRNTSIWKTTRICLLPLYSADDLQTGRFLRVYSLIGNDPLVNKVVPWTDRYWLRKHDKSGLKFPNIGICQPQRLVWAGLPTSKSVIIYKKGSSRWTFVHVSFSCWRNEEYSNIMWGI